MTREQMKAVAIGTRVKWVGAGGSALGTVTERLTGNRYRIVWDDGGGTRVIWHRDAVDREWCKRIEIVTTPT